MNFSEDRNFTKILVFQYQIILGALCRSRAANRKMNRRRAGPINQKDEKRKISSDELIDPELGMVTVDLHASDGVSNNNCDSQHGKEEPKTWVPCGDMWPPGDIVYMTETPEFKLG